MRVSSLLIVASFLAAQVLAFFVGANLLAAGVSVTQNPADVANSLYFFGSVLVASLLLLLVLRFYKGRRLFLGLELLLLFTAANIFASLFSSELVALFVGIAAVVARLLIPKLKNALLVFSSGVVGALLGASLDIGPAALFAVLLAAYDVYAVFGSKHMVTLAQELGKRQAAFSIELKREHENVQLGTGDLVIPAVLAVSALRLSPLAAAGALVGSATGIALLFYVIEKKKGYWPALPPLVFFSLVGIGAALWLP